MNISPKRTVLLTLVIAVFCAGGAAGSASAQQFTVTSQADTGTNCNATPADCTLREAIGSSNATATDDQIAVPGGNYPMLSQPTITKPAGKLTVDAAGATLDGLNTHRVLGISSNTANVTLNGLTISNGRRSVTTQADGGGLAVQGEATVALNAVSIIGNDVVATGIYANGGGIYNDRGTITISDSTISGNTATAGDRAGGGGIYNESGAVTIVRSKLNGNKASTPLSFSQGGAILVKSDAETATLDVSDSTISNNQAVGTGTAYGQGGGIANFSGSSVPAQTTLTGSTVSDNTASGLSGATGGGIYGSSDPNLTGGSFSVKNTTIDDNRALSGMFGKGGGASLAAISSLENVTLTSNQASGAGGGLFKAGGSGASMTIKHTIVAANSAPVDSACALAGMIEPVVEASLIDGEGASCDSDGVIATGDPKLAPLADNGGPTQTRALAADSPALDRVGSCPAADQRGVARPQGAACDLGAFELVPSEQALVPPAKVTLTLTLGLKKRQRLSPKGIKLTATCGNVACSTGTTATAKTGRRSIAFTTAKSTIAAGKKATIVLKPSKTNYKKLAKALRRSKSIKVALAASATVESAAASAKQSTSLKLLKPKRKR